MSCSCYALFLACTYNDNPLIKECLEKGYKINAQNTRGETPLIKLLQERTHTADKLMESVKLLVERGADVSVVDYNGCDALTHSRHPQITEYLKSCIKKPADLPLELSEKRAREAAIKLSIKNGQNLLTLSRAEIDTFDIDGFTPFMWSIWYQSQDHFNHFLNCLGANVNLKNSDGRTPLMIACYKFNKDMMEQLIAKGADINELDNFGNSTITYLLMSWRPYTSREQEVLEYVLEEAGADLHLHGCHGKRLFTWAAINKMLPSLFIEEKRFDQATQTFLNDLSFIHGEDIEVNYCDNEGNTVLGYLAYQGMTDIIIKLFSLSETVKVDLCGKKGRTPLSWAVTGNDLKMCQFLLEKGAQINHVDFNGCTALTYARKYNYGEISDFLVKNGAIERQEHPLTVAMKTNNMANFQAFSENNNLIAKLGTSPLKLAIIAKKANFVKFLVENGANCCQKDKNADTPLIYAINSGNIEIIKLLLNNGAKPTIHSGFSTALETKNLEIVKQFIESGAKLDKVYGTKGTPVLQAVRLKNEKLLELLLESGASPNTKETQTPLIAAICLNYYAIAKLLIEKGADVNKIPQEGKLSPIQVASKLQKFKMVQLLVENKAELNSVHGQHESPLRYAILLNNLKIAELLIESGAKVCEIVIGKMSLLQLAVENRNIKMAKALMNKDATILRMKTYFPSPLRKAVEMENIELVKYFVQNGANVNGNDDDNKQSLVQLAIKKQNFTLATYLLEKGASIAYNRKEIDEYRKIDLDFDEFFAEFENSPPSNDDDVIVDFFTLSPHFNSS